MKAEGDESQRAPKAGNAKSNIAAVFVPKPIQNGRQQIDRLGTRPT
jgi:hypothetical protein